MNIVWARHRAVIRSKNPKQTWTDHVADADAERDGEVEDSQNSGPHVLDEQVADEGRGDGAVGRFTDANLNKTKASLGK